MYHCSFSKALDLVMQSKHGDSLFAFCEGLIDSGSQEELQKTKEALFPESTCWFEHFPPRAKPSDCIILAGEGATSTLHRDPFEWTGTSICLEGTKVWRFVPPPGATASSSRQKRDDRSNVHIIDQALDAYRLDSIAWGDGDGNDENDITISAGWQSDLSLFAQRDNTIPGARILAEIEEEQGEEAKLRFIASAAINTGMLYPDDNLDVPTTPWAGVQKPGDLIVIPAYWWHQTYATEPSLAVASQRCGTERDARRVARHLLETATRELNKDRILPVDNIIKDNCTPKAVVDELFRYLQSIKI